MDPSRRASRQPSGDPLIAGVETEMKWILLILVPVIGSVILTHFISGWTDFRVAILTFFAVFAVIGGIEAITFSIARMRPGGNQR